MKLQRPYTAMVLWKGHHWTTRLRVAPGDKRRINCDHVSNDNAFERRADYRHMLGWFASWQPTDLEEL